MAYVNREITSEDRERFDLQLTDKWLFLANPSRDWTIDEQRRIFIRLIRLCARWREDGQGRSYEERDFHFHWSGRNFLLFTRIAADLKNYTGRQFGQLEKLTSEEFPFSCYIRGISEVGRNIFNQRFGVECNDEMFFVDLREAFSAQVGGILAKESQQDKYSKVTVAIKVADRVEVAS